MGRPSLKRNFWVSTAVHCGILLLIILVPLIMNCRMRKKEKPREIITYIDFAAPSAAPAAAPEIPAPPVVEPPPAPPPKRDIPEPPKEKKKIEISKKRVKRDEPAPPKKPDTPKLSEEEIRKLLQMGAKPSHTATATADDLPGWYYALVRQTMFEAWEQPGGLVATPGQIARIRITVERDGRITARKLVSSSGVQSIDDSAMAAVQRVPRLKALPASFPGKNKEITIDFELTGP
ncbi:MAG: TonB family protein [Spartobacteria bacterium]|nr:TonB family protein [Spartobacteria bacterium]